MASDVPTITEEMLEEEKRLAEERALQEAAEAEALLKTAPKLETTTFSKLDELLNQTQIYSQFLLEQMDDIALVSIFTQPDSLPGLVFNALLCIQLSMFSFHLRWCKLGGSVHLNKEQPILAH